MQKVLTAAEMREVDRLTTERYGIPSIILMENAANAAAQVITKKLGGSVKGKSILILCGKGNNGGDGAAIARILFRSGAHLEVYLFSSLAETKGDARINFESVRKLHEPYSDLFFESSKLVDEWVHTTGFEYDKFDLIVDALFGTGLSTVLNPTWSNVPLALNQIFVRKKRNIVSVDIPSGLYSDSPILPDVHLSADCTVTFTSPKPANVLAPACRHNGELIVADIGSPPALIAEQPSQLFVTERADVAAWMLRSEFTPESYKNKRGHALLIAGSEKYAGAAVLCGNAAIRSGVGLVTIGTPRSSKDLVGGRILPEVMVRPLAETESGAVSEQAIEEIEKFSKNINAIAIGAGLSANDDSTRRFVKHFVENRRMPTILDADALTLLAPFEPVFGDANAPPIILTPHEGEFMRLLGTDDKEVIKDRVGAVRKFAQEKSVILVLKGERVLIGHPDGRVVVNPTGNSGLGKAGNGDTLLGILTGFAAQAAAMDIDMFETIVAGVYIAGLAGDIAAEKFGKRVMTASDTRDSLAEAFRRCEAA
jgi:ADP-dependent NAD(P)H-hydrate dehydratase / NAD(P)H-hydrate epimerase